MHIILVPGLWLDAASWHQVATVVENEGHRPHPLTLPGMHSTDADRSQVTLDDVVGAVVSEIDACDPADGAVLLVGHSAGAAVAHAALDARPERVARVVYVGGFAAADGHPIVAGFPTDGGDLLLPSWDDFDEADLRDLDAEARTAFRSRAIPSPASLTTEPVRLEDDRRYGVPATVVCTEFTAEMLQGWLERDLEPVRELARMRHVEYVAVPTGHWPQLTRPEELGLVLAQRAYEPYVDEFGRMHPPSDAAETPTTLGFLEYQRATLEWKAHGLDASGLSTRIAESELSLGGLLKHMAYVEDSWFSRWLHNRELSPPWNTVDWSADRDWEFHSAGDDAPEELRRLWRTAVGRSRALVADAIAAGGLDRRALRTADDGETVNLRWILTHMIEEYARHNAHADLLREAIDGEAGE